ncbi:autotransporter-associated beta strand repeat-containing protein [Deltaproteobacteria bacterium OttesenSCG-928-M10]|nr:autotransporter-associated beta strand repeat-containing protein [Deltaproteobacteria bacterium OttesenSCG-928-M10]
MKIRHLAGAAAIFCVCLTPLSPLYAAGQAWTGGSGTWNDSNTNWDGSDTWQGVAGVFVDANLHITVEGQQDFNSLSFQADGISLLGNGSLGLAGATGTIGVATSGSTYLNVLLEGPGTLVKTGGGILHLSRANTYSGGTRIDDGRLYLENARAAGSGRIDVNGHSLWLSFNGTLANSLIGAGGAGSVAITRYSRVGLDASGFTGLVQNYGTLLAGRNDFGGDLYLADGSLTIVDKAAGDKPLKVAGDLLGSYDSSNKSTLHLITDYAGLHRVASYGNALQNDGNITFTASLAGGLENAAQFPNVIPAGKSIYGQVGTAENPVRYWKDQNAQGDWANANWFEDPPCNYQADWTGGATGVFLGSGQTVDLGGKAYTFNALQFLNDGYALENGVLNFYGPKAWIEVDDAFSATLTSNLKLSGAGQLVKTGGGTLILENINNDYAGGTAILGGAVSVTDMEALGAANSAVLLDGGALIYTADDAGSYQTSDRPFTLGQHGGTLDISDSSGALILNGRIDGPGGLTKTGLGALGLGAANSFAGGLSIEGGVLGLLHNQAAGSGEVDVKAGAALALGFDGAFSNLISGAGDIYTAEDVNVTLSADSSAFAGQTIVSSDSTLTMGGPGAALGGRIIVVDKGTLAGSGRVGSALTDVYIEAGGTFQGGAGLHVVDRLYFHNNSFADFQLGGGAPQASTVGGSLFVGTGVKLKATLDRGGLYTLFDAGTGSTIDNSFLTQTPNVTWTNTGTEAYRIIHDTTNDKVYLEAKSDNSKVLYWAGGLGDKWAAGSKWSDTYGSPLIGNTTWNFNQTTAAGVTGVFLGGGAVEVDSNVYFSNLQFKGDTSITDADNNGQLVTATGGGIMDVDDGATATVGAEISGDSLTKTGGGALVLGNNNNAFDGLNIYGGTVSVADTNALGDTNGAIAMNNGATLKLTSNSIGVNYSKNGNLTLGDNGGGVIEVANATVGLRLYGEIADAGGLTKTGAGDLALYNGDNDYAGGSLVKAGELVLGHSQAAGSGAIEVESGARLGLLFFDGGVLANNIFGDGVLVAHKSGANAVSGTVDIAELNVANSSRAFDLAEVRADNRDVRLTGDWSNAANQIGALYLGNGKTFKTNGKNFQLNNLYVNSPATVDGGLNAAGADLYFTLDGQAKGGDIIISTDAGAVDVSGAKVNLSAAGELSSLGPGQTVILIDNTSGAIVNNGGRHSFNYAGLFDYNFQVQTDLAGYTDQLTATLGAGPTAIVPTGGGREPRAGLGERPGPGPERRPRRPAPFV